MSSSRSRGSLGTSQYSERREFDSLFRDFNEMSHFAVRGITFATEAATDLEEAEEQEELNQLDVIVRDYIDLENKLGFQRTALNNLKIRFDAGHKFAKNYETQLDDALNKYETKSENEKYFQNENYIEFRQKIWDVNHPDETMPPLDKEADDEIVMGKQKESLYCPITTLLLEEPVTSNVCKHTFSKDAIMQLIRRNMNSVPCPMTGCDKYIMEHNLQPNKRIERKVEQYKAHSEDLMDDVETSNVLSYILVLVVNSYLEVVKKGPSDDEGNDFKGNSTHDVPLTYILPATYTFGIWGLIYALLGGFIIYQWFEPADNAAINVLIFSYINLEFYPPKNLFDRFFIHYPFTIYPAWLVVATTLNFWVAFKAIDTVFFSTIVVAVIGIIGVSFVDYHKRKDALFAGTLAWALIGIAIKQYKSIPILIAASVSSGLIIGGILRVSVNRIIAWYHLRTRSATVNNLERTDERSPLLPQ
ncbi:1587_t:CDS:2 [Gigaspora margarita]|uniref:1587_t:CDS:1 n=1 Tax=Gigaspora margarita TaxID=4874 RepID=A0ABN7VNS2_GIGMA|nr:1587_t:CDS:2 [Gigaspora margarita]